MNWFSVWAKGHHGYPQPEDGYETNLYSDSCLRCGAYGSQINPLRIRSSMKASQSDFLQLNWIFDIFMVRPEVEISLVSEWFSSVSFMPVINHRTGSVLPDLRQLSIPTIISCAETLHLPKVTCMPNNEESEFESFGGGEKRYTPDTPYCGRVKYHSPSPLVLDPIQLKEAPELFQTVEWFGSGGCAFRKTICSERFVQFFRSQKWRGLGFDLVAHSGHSERAT